MLVDEGRSRHRYAQLATSDRQGARLTMVDADAGASGSHYIGRTEPSADLLRQLDDDPLPGSLFAVDQVTTHPATHTECLAWAARLFR
jgi:hypothetical protein